MEKIIFILCIALTFTQKLNAQITLCLGQDATVCPGQSVQIQDCGNIGGTIGLPSSAPYTINSIPYTPDPLNAGTSVTLSDDSQTSLIPIGFDFCFWGNTYNQMIIGANNFLTFSSGNSATWLTTPIPNSGFVPKNCIMGPWQDINPGIGGTVKYQLYGTAPFRRMSVSWNNVPMFSCTGQLYSSQIIIYETTNVIETFIMNKSICSSWNGGNAVHGLHNIGGTQAVVYTGRNNTQWTASNEGTRFTPGALGIEWANTLGQSFPYNNGILNVTTVPPGTTGYFLRSTCSPGSGGISDTTWLTTNTPSLTASSTSDTCSSGIGTVTANPTNGIAPYTFNWPALGQTTQTVNGVYAGTYLVQMTDAAGCTSNATVVVGDTPASFSGTTTVVSCPGGSDGTATAVMTPALGNITYQWDDPASQTTPTATGLSAGTYTCVVTSDIGCQGVVIVNVTEIPGMIASIANQSDVTCNSSNDGMIEVTVNQGTPAYTYSWDNSTSTSNIASDLYAGTHTVTITDANGCTIDVTGTIGEPSRLMVTYVTPDSMICSEDDITLTAIGTGGSSPYTFTWLENGNTIGTGTSITVDPLFTNTQYCVVLSEACGSPTHDSCMVVTFPTPIDPSITPNKLQDCTPGFFEFANTSINGAEIATTYFEFSDGTSIMETGSDSTSNTFEIPNFYSCNMTITSIYGCVYTGSFTNIIEVKPLPVADFTFSSNPATFFETSIQLQDRSTVDVIDWEWFSPGSTPSVSNSQNPVFTFPEGEVGTYPVTLRVTTEHGCTDTVTYIMNVVSDILFYAPNTFTPDDDEYNQAWGIFIEGIDVYQFDLYIFNRWGEMIWESHDKDAKWDGTYGGLPVPQGTYVWRASAKDRYNDGKYEFQGHINVIR